MRATLHARQIEPVLRAATSLGFRVEPLGEVGATRPGAMRVIDAAGAAALTIERAEAGQLVLGSFRGPELIERVVREDVLLRAQAHLAAQGMRVRVRRLASGEIELEGVEARAVGPDGQARVEARVERDGALRVEVGGLSGSRCEDVAQGIARAVEGERRDVARKPEFFRTPVAQQGRLRV